MGHKLTFKEYVESKTTLLAAIDKTPQCVVEYNVSKYCKLVVGESMNNKEHIGLKPNQKVLVEWKYEDVDNPTIVNISFSKVDKVDPSQQYNSYWGTARLQRWLLSNTQI